MTSELSRAELVELFNSTAPKSAERMKAINIEMATRLKDIEEISEKIARQGVRSLEELDSLLKDVENHQARVYELKREADVMMADVIMDLDAISKAER